MKKKLFIVLFSFILTSVIAVNIQADDLKGYFIPEYYVVANHHDGDEGI